MSEAASPGRQTEALLTGLAILKINADERGHGYIDNFVPFAAEWLRSDGRDVVPIGDIQAGIKSSFGIELPLGALTTVLARAARLGLLEKRGNDYLPRHDELQKLDLSRQRGAALRQYEALVERLQKYAAEEHGRKLTADQAGDALLAYVENRAVPILKAALNIERFAPAGKELEFIVASFILRLFERDPQGFEYLETVVQGSMLASVLYFPDMGSVEQRLNGLVVYFDTPFLLGVLGYAGVELEASSRELVDLVYELGGRLACFEDTVLETHGVLTAVAHALRSAGRNGGAGGSVEEFALRERLSPTDLFLLAERLERDLRSRRIEIHQRSAQTRGLAVDEPALERLLQREVGYLRQPALLHDMNAITAVHRLRAGGKPMRLERASAIFITTNEPLVAAARQFFRTGDGRVPIAMLDHDLATLVWLKKPTAAPDLPRRQIIADCYAAMRPDTGLWSRYVAEIDRLRERGRLSEDDFFVLRYSLEARRALMGETLGEAKAVSEPVVQDVLETAKKSLTAPVTEELKKLQATAAEDRVARTEAERRAAEAEAKAEAAVKQLESFRAGRSQLARERAARHARWLAHGVFAVLSIAVLAAAVFSLPNSVVELDIPNGLAWLSRGLLLVGVIFGAANLIGGPSVRTAARVLEVRAGRALERRYVSRALSELGPG